MIADYSAWLTPERLEVEERLWEAEAIYRLYADAVMYAAAKYDCASVLELGCGTGWVPTLLPSSIEYAGLDANANCVSLAAQKNPSREFFLADIRGFKSPRYDLACSFAVLKHFALREWVPRLVDVLSLGRVGVFTMNVGEADTDDFEQGFPHTWVSPALLAGAVATAEHKIESMELLYTGETMVTTRMR